MSAAAPAQERAFVVILLAGISAALHVGKLPPALPVLQQELGITWVQAGFLLSLVQGASMLLGLVAGLLADGLGLRRCMMAGLVLLAVAGAAGGLVHSAAALLVLRGLEGVGFLLVTVPAPSLVRRTALAAQATRRLGVWGAFMPVGTATALLLGPLVIAVLGWPAWWWLAAGFSAAMTYAVARMVPADVPFVEVSPAAAGHGAQPQAAPWPQRLATTLSASGPWLLALAFAVYSAQWLAVIGFLPSLYQQSGWGGALGAVLTALVAGINMVGNVGAGRLLQRGVPPQWLLWMGYAAMALGTFLAFSAVTADSPVWRYGGALLFSALGGLIPGTLFAQAPRLAPSEQTIATTVGWMQQWSGIGQFAGPPLVAWVAAQAEGWQWSWMVTGTCCVAGAVLAGLMARHLRADPVGGHQ
ncbi:CynX/NimT family MFS transporter [Ottowia sp.]|uniref:MFS transporter n=1 Tax=Ottowia sp. TaxID=1898956 RepID=UPI003A8BB532